LPFSNEAARLIMALPNAYVIAGNKEGYLENLTGQEVDNKQMNAVYQTYRELAPDVTAYLRGLPRNLRLQSDCGTICVVHDANIDYYAHWTMNSSGVSDKMRVQPMPREAYLCAWREAFQGETFQKAIANCDAEVVLFGHNHLQGHGYSGKTLVINPGACGQPQDGDNRAAYSILDESNMAVEERRVPYDINNTIRAARETHVYAKAPIWLALVFATLREGLECFHRMFDLANAIQKEKNESGFPYTDETWEAAYAVYTIEQQTKE